MEKFEQNLRIYMNLRGMNQSDLAHQTHLTEAAISRYLHGDREPKAIALAAIANALKVSVDELLGISKTYQDDLDEATLLIARNAKNISSDQKKKLINALID